MSGIGRIQKIQEHPVFEEQTRLLRDAEHDRMFCRHTIEHFLDVARLMYIYNLEDGAGLDRELIYAAALLHDIGRYEQLAVGTPHHIAGARLAQQILLECGFSEAECSRITEAILHHRKEQAEEDRLAEYLYRADKQSRLCFACPAAGACNWPAEKRNRKIVY